MFDTLCIVGVGLIGGSFGLAAREKGLARRVVGVARRAETIEKAVKCGAVDEATSDVCEAARNADFVFLAPPVGQMKSLCEQIAPILRPGAIVTDAGSTKADIVRECGPIFAGKAAFVGGHPMAGSEQTGVEAARADLFEGATWILTPLPRTPDFAIENLKKCVSTVGAVPLVLDPDTHDALLAVTSHLPHVTATALVHLFTGAQEQHEDAQKLVAGGWRDATRVAAGGAEMWRDISLANSGALTQSVDDLIAELTKLRGFLSEQNGPALLDWFEQAAAVRRKVGYFPRR